MRKTMILQNGLIRMGNTGVYISFFTFVSAFFVIMSDTSVYTLIFLSGVLVHEAGHIFALHMCKTKPKKICIYPFGVDMKCDVSRLSYEKELFVMLSGAAVNLIICVISFTICVFAYSRELLFTAFCNAFFGITNLIPIKGLDGGRVLYVLLCMHIDEERASRICKVVSNVSYGILSLVFLIIILLTGANFSMIITLVFSALGAVLASHLLK